MAHIATVPPIRFINLDHPVGPDQENDQDDIYIVKVFLRYLLEHRPDLKWTNRRLPGLTWPSAAGRATVEHRLFEMIQDYKEFKQTTANTGWSSQNLTYLWLWPEEARNGRVVPQDERFAAGVSITSTIMALNSDVRPLPERLSWPGASQTNSIIDVLSSLYPGVAHVLSGLPVREDMNWRDLARKRIPYNQWFLSQKRDAERERTEANQRIGGHWVGDQYVQATDKERIEFMDADNELFRLQYPYRNEMEKFYASETAQAERQTETEITSSPNPSVRGQYVTLTATVTMKTTQMPVTEGWVTFNMIWGPTVRIVGNVGGKPVASGGGSLTQLGRQPLLNGTATIRTNMLHPGLTIVKADFPDTGNIIGSSDELPHQVN